MPCGVRTVGTEYIMTNQGRARSRLRGPSRWLWVILGGVILAAALFRGAASLFGAGQADLGPPVTGTTTVGARDNDFAPAAIAVPAGTTVTWAWEGNNDHNVVGDGFESPVQTRGEFAYSFADPGTYDDRCTLHGGMHGEVVVTTPAA